MSSREEIIDYLLDLCDKAQDPAWLADLDQRVAAQEAARTDPWRWYCRLCGATGEAETSEARDQAALGHIKPGEPCGHGQRPMQEWSGRLLHVWTY